MKKLILSAFIFSTGLLVGQEIQLSHGDTQVSGESGEVLSSKIDVTNGFNEDKEIIASREIISMPMGANELFCWGPTCYPPKTQESTPELIMAGETNTTFKADYYPAGDKEVAEIKYCFTDKANASNQACFITKYAVGAVGVNELENRNVLQLSSANPANNMAIFTYSLKDNANAQLKVMSLAGAVAANINLESDKEAILVDLSHVKSGLYIYSLVLDGKVMSYEKLVVKH